MVKKLSRELYRTAQIDAIDQAVVAMEQYGFLLDAEYCGIQEARARDEEASILLSLREELAALGVPSEDPDAIWSSPKQMVGLLHGTLGLPKSPVWKKGKVKLDKGEVKTDEAALAWIALRAPHVRGLIGKIIELRRTRGCIKYLSKLPTYIGPDGRIHPTCGPAGDGDDRAGALTGRLAFKHPEGQQMPNSEEKDKYDIRRAFIAGPGNVLVVADYSALEVVILAHILIVLFGDPQLAELTKPGAPDIHSVNARKVFGTHLGWTDDEGRKVAEYDLAEFKKKGSFGEKLRKLIKTIWYGLMYGKGAYGFGSSLTDDEGNPIGEELAGRIVDALLAEIPGIRRYQEWVRQFIWEHLGIPSLGGRWCPLADLIKMGSAWAMGRAWRRALNFPMQASGADIVGAAMVLVHNDPQLREWGFRVILQIHDEIVLEGPEEHAEEARLRVKYLMENAYALAVGLQVQAKVAKCWSDGK